MKILDRDKVLQFINQYADKAPVGKEAKLTVKALGVVLCGWPVVDAEDMEPVVRCKNCKQWDDSTEGRYVGGWCFCERMQISTSPEFYCADGEKMDGEEEK